MYSQESAKLKTIILNIYFQTQQITNAVALYSPRLVQNFKTKHLPNWSYVISNASSNAKTKALWGLLKSPSATMIQIRDAMCTHNGCSDTYMLGRHN